MDNTQHHNDIEKPGHIMQQLAGEYLGNLQVRQYSPRSVNIYSIVLKDFQSYLADLHRERVQDITAQDLEAYRLALVQRNFAPSSLEVYLRSVRQFFNWLNQNQRLFVNPAAELIIPMPPRKLQHVPSEEEINKLLAQPNITTQCGLRDRALLETAYATGGAP